MAFYGYFKNCLEAVKTKYYSYKKPSNSFYRDVKEIINQLYAALQYEEISREQDDELEKEFRRFCPD